MAASFALCPNRSGRERPAKVDTFVPPDFDDRANEIIASCPRALTCVLLIQINRMRIERTFLLVVPRSPPPPAARWELSLKVPIACWRALRQILFLRLGDPSDADRGEVLSPLHSWRHSVPTGFPTPPSEAFSQVMKTQAGPFCRRMFRCGDRPATSDNSVLHRTP